MIKRKKDPADPVKASNGPALKREELIEEFYERYARQKGVHFFTNRFRFWMKKKIWAVVIGGAKLFKRTLDIVFSIWMFIILTPLFISVASLIKLTDKGPVLFWQKRVGKWGKEFMFPKFRSMGVDAEKEKESLLAQSHHADSITFKMKRDPRVTWIGRIIRKLSIDELPQLWNVIKGEMTLVGPRPPIPEEVDQYTLKDRRRLDITPGLTCIWQVSGRGDVPFDKQVEYDIQYIESHSIWMDFKILLKTVSAVLSGRGAY